jgi:hypothetical protein
MLGDNRRWRVGLLSSSDAMYGLPGGVRRSPDLRRGDDRRSHGVGMNAAYATMARP